MAWEDGDVYFATPGTFGAPIEDAPDWTGWTPMGLTDGGVNFATPASNAADLIASTVKELTVTTQVKGDVMDRLRDMVAADMRRRVELDGRVTVPLRTGERGGRSGAEHARRLAVARLKRRRQRRHGIPAATTRRIIVIPNASITVPKLDGLKVAFDAMADSFAGIAASLKAATRAAGDFTPPRRFEDRP